MKPQNDNGFEITQNYDCITDKEVFPNLLKVLMAYAYKLIGSSTNRLQKSRDELAYDFSMEAIKKHLEKPKKFDPFKNPDLVKYLKYYILRQIVSNYKVKKSQELEIGYDSQDSIDLIVENSFVKENDIHELIDRQNILQSIKVELKENPNLMKLFNLRYLEEYSRKEICEILEISFGEYANRIRRLNTVVNRVLKQRNYE